MTEKSSGKRFSTVAIEKGFITKEQFVEAMGMQIENDLEGKEHKFIGSVLYGMGYMTLQQINEVLEAMSGEAEKP